MIPAVLLGPGQPTHRASHEALENLLAERYAGKDVQTLFSPTGTLTRHDFIDFLTRYSPSSLRWSMKRLERLWKEVYGRHPDAFLVALRDEEGPWRIERNIRTLTVRIYVSLPNPRRDNPNHHDKLFVREFRMRRDGTLKMRPYENSASEKIYWTELTLRGALLRILRNEFGFIGRKDPETGERRRKVTNALLERLTLMDSVSFQYFKGGVQTATEFSTHPSKKFPGFITNNNLWHGTLDLTPEYYKSWYHERRTPNLFVPGPVHTPPPIPHLSSLGLRITDFTIDDLEAD